MHPLLGFGLVASAIGAANWASDKNNRKKAKDMIYGGLADNASPQQFDKRQLAKGTRVEMEHTNNPAIAREIAMDHLTEDPRYYIELEKMEKKLEKSRRSSMKKVQKYKAYEE